MSDRSLRDAGGPDARTISTLRGLLAQRRDADALALAGELSQRFPRHPFGWEALAEALMRAGRAGSALDALRRAADLSPGDVDLRYQLGLAAQSLGRLAEAAGDYRRVLALRPNHAPASFGLGSVLMSMAEPQEAERCLRAAVAAQPGSPEAHTALGNALITLGRGAEAEPCLRRALELQPDFAAAHTSLGGLYHARGQLTEARASLERAVQLAPQWVAAHNNLGNVLQALGLLAAAEASFERALRLDPNVAQVHNNLGCVRWAQGRHYEAGAAYGRAVALEPRYAEAHNNLGDFHLACGRAADAEVSYRRALALQPDSAATRSNLLLSLAYRDDLPRAAIAAAHREHGALLAGPYAHRPRACPERRPRATTATRLRVGYVSPDFRQHSVAHFLGPLLRAHDPQRVEVFCYAQVVRPDAVTAEFRELAAHWLSSVELADASLAERIAADRIDVLVDLAGHTAGNRLPVFAHRPAPVQVSWLGYPDTTGLPGMDYRLVDAITDPPGEADTHATETLIRLPDGFLCFAPPAGAGAPPAPPCLASGRVTFGSFNNPAKLSARTLSAWAEILAAVPDARLLLKAQGLDDAATRQELLRRLQQHGADPARIELVGRLERAADHLAAYERIDVALDPFPYNGTTTTCEALWMGVPVVSLLGERHAGRVGASLLTQLELRELIAASVGEYVELARALAADRARLAALRSGLRARMQDAPLCDAPRFARKLEATFERLSAPAPG